MARADRRRSARAGAHDRSFERRYESAHVGTEELFFQRIRRQAKWMFVFLAAVFGIGFVAFGVGSDVQGGIADVIGIGQSGGDGLVSEDEARERLEDKPNDPQALRDLASALQRDGKPDEAIAPLETYTALRPKDEDAQTELASLYLAKATRLSQDLQLEQLRAQFLNPGADFLPPSTTPLGQAFANQPVTQAVTQEVNERVNALYTEVQAAFTQAKDVYLQIAKLRPQDPSVQIQLADAAVNAGDTQTAVRAYKRFVALAPDDPSAPLVRQEIKRLEATAALSAGSAG